MVRLGPVHEQRVAGGREVEHDDAVVLLDERARGSSPTQPRAEVPPRAIAGRLGELEERLRAERVVVERAVELLGRALVEHARDPLAVDHLDRAGTSRPAARARAPGAWPVARHAATQAADREAVPPGEHLVVGARAARARRAPRTASRAARRGAPPRAGERPRRHARQHGRARARSCRASVTPYACANTSASDRPERRAQLRRRPHVELALLALAVGVERRPQPARRIGQLALEERDGLGDHLARRASRAGRPSRRRSA